MSVRETNCTIQWIEIYLVDSVIRLLNKWGQNIFFLRTRGTEQNSL